MLTLLDEFSREAIAVEVGYNIKSIDVIETLAKCFAKHGVPEHIRSDNGSEFTSTDIKRFLRNVGTETLYITPGSPWENGYNERFNGTLRNEILNANWFQTTQQAQATINCWVKEYNHIRPHQGLGMKQQIPQTTTLKLAQTNGD